MHSTKDHNGELILHIDPKLGEIKNLSNATKLWKYIWYMLW